MKKIIEFERFLSLPLIFRSKFQLLMRGNYLQKLNKKKGYQRVAFLKLRVNYSNLYRQISKYSVKKYVTPTWADFNQKMESVLLPLPPLNFLTNSLIMYSMVMTKGGKLMDKQIDFIEKTYGKKTTKIVLEEDLVGSPMVVNRKYLTSHNRVHQLYHLARYERSTKDKVSGHRVIAEWGAGYGNMVVVVKRLVKHPLTYISIDTPLFLCLQWLYLSTIFGPDKVNLITLPNQKIVKNKINLVPVSLLEKTNLSCDLFITNWALSESSKTSQDFVARKKWFGAKHLLIGYQEKCEAFEQAEGVGKMVEESGGVIEDLKIIPANYYAFK